MKKILSMFLCLLMVVSVIPIIGLTASAEIYGYYTFTVSDSEVTITDCSTSISGNITIPSTLVGCPVTSIGDDAFEDCTRLTSIIIPNSVTSICYRAFTNCTSLKSITIGNSVKSIGWGAFTNCTSLINIIVDKDNSNYCDVDGVLYNKDKTELIRYPIGNTKTSYSIPDSVTSIGGSAFSYCTSLTSVTIPDSVTSIGGSAFSYCTSLKSITIPNSVTSIGSSAFYNTGYYNNEDNWKNNVLYIGNYLIDTKTSISGEYTIKDGTKVIADDAFYRCTSLTSVTIPNSVTSIGYDAFYRCESLTSVTIGDGVTSIGSYAFYGCTSLTSITIPDSVTSVGSDAFNSCTSLTSVTIGNGVTSIGYNAFDNTGYYNNEDNWEDNVLYIGNYLIDAKINISGDYTIKEGTKVIADGAFSNCKLLTSIIIPNSVISISQHAFSWCTSLTSVTISDGIASIGDIAFYRCESLTSITIPDSVTSVGSDAFNSCISLTSVTIPNSVKIIGFQAFGYTYDYKIDDYVRINDFIINGYTNSEAERYAKRNGINFIDINNPHTHSYTSKITKQPTCTQKGIRTYTCNCGDSYTETIPTKAHSYKWIVTKKASYVSTGTKSYKCTVCGKVSKTTSIAKLKLKTPNVKYTGEKKKLKVDYKNVTGVNGFQLRYKIKGKWKVKTFKPNKTSTKLIKKLKKGTYKVQIRSFVNNGSEKSYSKWSKTKTVKVK